MAELDPNPRTPRAVIHKRVLEVAEANPTMSIEGLAAAVSGASPDLVERVLEEYGEPAADAGGDQLPAEQPMSTDTAPPTDEQLSEKQLAVLRAIREHPEATQRELAERLGVARATISNRVNAIDGLDWETRREFVEAFFDDPSKPAPSDEEATEPIDGLRDRVERIESRLDGDRSGRERPVEDPELAAKVIRACVAAEGITEDEEVRVIRALLG